MQDKKKQGGIGSMIAIKIKPGKEKTYEQDKTEDGAIDENATGLDACSEEIISAVREGDAGALKEALSAFFEMYSVSEGMDAESEEDQAMSELRGD